MIGESVCDGLRAERYAVDWVRDGKVADATLARQVYDLVLLDLGLPGMDGMDLLAAYRKRGGVAPVLVLTARGERADRIRGLDSGADDYLVKPFDLDEMYARVRALLRRHPVPQVVAASAAGVPRPILAASPHAQAPAAGLPRPNLAASPRAQAPAAGAPGISCRGLVFNPLTGEITFKGSPLRLNGREYAVMRALLDPPGVVVSRERLEALLVKVDPAASGSADREVFMLRNKFGNDFIRNVSGAGYMIATE